MKKKRTGILGVLLAVLALGIGYAAVNAITLTITGSGTISSIDDNFKVEYTSVAVANKSSNDITTTQSVSGKTGTFTVTGMTKKGDYAEFTFTITNSSQGLSAVLGTPAIASGYNSEYFTVTSTTNSPTTLTSTGATNTTTQTVRVETAKTPTADQTSGKITITLEATPQPE